MLTAQFYKRDHKTRYKEYYSTYRGLRRTATFNCSGRTPTQHYKDADKFMIAALVRLGSRTQAANEFVNTPD